MRNQPNRNYVSNDEVQTPKSLTTALVQLLNPKGRILEPCIGAGNFLSALPSHTEWCEIKRGRDFFKCCDLELDWIITNPPWSQIRPFLSHAFLLAKNVSFLMTINHVWTKARLRDTAQFRFGIKRIIMVSTPKSFPQTGFQLGMIHYQYAYSGPITLASLDGEWE